MAIQRKYLRQPQKKRIFISMVINLYELQLISGNFIDTKNFKPLRKWCDICTTGITERLEITAAFQKTLNRRLQ